MIFLISLDLFLYSFPVDSGMISAFVFDLLDTMIHGFVGVILFIFLFLVAIYVFFRFLIWLAIVFSLLLGSCHLWATSLAIASMKRSW